MIEFIFGYLYPLLIIEIRKSSLYHFCYILILLSNLFVICYYLPLVLGHSIIEFEVGIIYYCVFLNKPLQTILIFDCLSYVAGKCDIIMFMFMSGSLTKAILAFARPVFHF